MPLVRLYDKVLNWAEHKHAAHYLAAISFIESSFFPIPPDVMLAPMSLAKPQSAFWFAFIATVSSVIGGLAGYLIGHIAFEPLVQPFLVKFGYMALYEQVLTWFDIYGFWLMLIAGFSPIPYKLFTIGAGVLNYNLPIFIIGSILGRAGRFYLVSGLMRWGGKPMADKLRSIIDKAGWGMVFIIVVGATLKFIW